MYDLLEQIKSIGKEIKDSITGKTVADEIENELHKYRTLTAGSRPEPLIVRDALKVYNQLTAYAISDEEFEMIIKNYLQYGIKEKL